MPGPSLISDYLAALSAQLPAPMVEELADGLDQTCQHYLRRGLDPQAAARAAVAEFGEPAVIVAAFIRACPPRHTARRLLATGPAVGACWAIALISRRAWTWPVPVAVPLLFGLVLIAIIGLLAAAAFGSKYRPVGRAGAAGRAGISILDAAMLMTVTLAGPALVWPLIPAVTASAARLIFTAWTFRPGLAT
jgi:hypothetical protein